MLRSKFILKNEIFEGKTFVEYIRQSLIGVRNIGNVFKVVWISSVVVRNLLSVCPHSDRRASGVAVGTELCLAVLEFRLFHLDDNIGGINPIFAKDNDVGAFLFSAEIDEVFKPQTLTRIMIPVQKAFHIQLADKFFRF